MEKKFFGADVVRCTACFSVISVHFFLNNGFYSVPLVGWKMLLMLLFRTLFMVCVPLFILLTGFLMKNKKLEKSYYKKANKTIVIYLLASLFVGSFKLLTKEYTAPSEILGGILNFTAAPYAWYVEMYIGLFLLIPFLNIMYNNLPSENGKRVLLITLFGLTSLPLIVNVYNFESFSWWTSPAASNNYLKIIPDWWKNIYPLTYYFIGAYIREHRLKISPFGNRLLILTVWSLSFLYNLWRVSKGTFIWGAWSDWGSPFNLILSVLVFHLLVNKDYTYIPKTVKSTISFISPLCLGIYLVSFVFDRIYYTVLNGAVPVVTDRIFYYFLIVPAVFISSAFISFLLDRLYRLLSFICKKIQTLKTDKARQKLGV